MRPSSTMSTRLSCSSVEEARKVDAAARLGGLRVDGEEERGAVADFALHPDAAAHGLDDALGDDEAEAGAAVAARDGGVALAEGLEEPVEPLLGDARARVAHLELQLDPLAIRARRRGCSER